MLIESPVGTIMAWILRVDSDGEAVDLPDGWISCNGSVIPEGSIWAGKQVPDLNGERRFLRGGSEEEMLTLEDDQIMEHTHHAIESEHTHPYVDIHWDYVNEGDGPVFVNPFNDAFKVDHSKTTELAYTDISVSGVSSMYKHGEENRPKNMGVIWIIRVW